MENVIIKDVCEVFLEADTEAHFLGLTASNEITQTVDTSEIRGGIGNGIINQLTSNKALQFTVTTAIHSDSVYEIQSGTTFEDGSATVQKTESCVLTSGKLTVEGTPTGATAIVFDKHGKKFDGSIVSKDVTITGGTEGDTYTVVYPCQVTGSILDLRVDTFPKNYKTQLHSIAYDADSNEVVADVYWVFDKAQPDGGLKASFQAGQNVQDEMTFKVQKPGTANSYGKYIVVPRVAA
jgi:hypothetical protein